MPSGRPSSSSIAGASRVKVENMGISELFTRFFCNYCQEEINGLCVSCTYCTDFDLCPECFQEGSWSMDTQPLEETGDSQEVTVKEGKDGGMWQNIQGAIP